MVVEPAACVRTTGTVSNEPTARLELVQTATEVSASMNTPAPTSAHSSHFLTDVAISCHCVLPGGSESTEVLFPEPGHRG